MDNIGIKPIADEVETFGEAVEITDEEAITITIGDKDFQLNNPIIVNTIFDYNENNELMKTETDINSILVGGGEEKKESEFFYNENGKLIKEVETSSEGTAESIIEYDEDNRVIKVETPLSIIENDWIDEENYKCTTKNKLKEIYTVDTYKKYAGNFELISSVTKNINDELLSETIREIDEEADTVTITTKNITKTEDGNDIENNIKAICEFSTGLILSSENIDYCVFTNANIKFIRNEKKQLTQLIVSTADGETRIIDYNIEEDENGGYTTTSKYESIYVKESDDIIINENTLLNNGPISFTQNIVSKGYNIECHINNATIDKKEKLYQFESINIDNPEEGVTIKFSKMIDRQEGDSIFKRSLEASFKLDGKLYTIVNGLFDIYTKVSVGNIMDDNQLEDLIEVNVKSTDNSELVEYISDKLKEYIDKNEDLKSLLSISKVIISL